MRFEILPSLPPYGPIAKSFTERGDQYREGLVVRFYPNQSDPWVGNFLGGMTKYTNVLAHPNGSDVIVVANGSTCVIDPEWRVKRDGIAWEDITAVFSLQQLGLVVFQGLVDFAAIRADNSVWLSPRISWDGFRNIKVHESELTGEAWTAIGDSWVPFTLDLLTGRCSDGIYEYDMGRAVHVPNR